jgi:ketosteroid isomerase-like protein
VSASEFDDVVDQYHRAIDAFMKGDAEPAKRLFSRGDDVSLANPFGPVARGWDEVAKTMERAASNYSGGEALAFDRVSGYGSDELTYIVEVERLRSKVGGADSAASLALRVTTIFRRDQNGWTIIHRHADPITTPRGPESVLPR